MFTEEQLIVKLTEFRSMPIETEWLEFKEAKKDFDSRKLGKYFSALSNEANLKKKQSGWLIFGIKDKLPRTIVGTRYRISKKDLESLKHEIAQQTNGITFQEIYEVEVNKKRVILMQIPAALPGIPTSWQGHYHGRNGSSLGALSLPEQDEIRNQAPKDWSTELCPNASIKDLDRDALKLARKKVASKNSRLKAVIKKWKDEVFLEKIKLLQDGQLTRAAIILLGKPEASVRLSPHPVQITWRLMGEEEGYEHFGPPFLLNIEEIYNKIRNVNYRIQPFNRLLPVEIAKYDPNIVLEALNNCIAHQDYFQNARIIVTEYRDKLVLQNIGNFFDGKVEDYLLHERTPYRYRNTLLAQAMVSLDMIDTLGMGIRRMFHEQRKRFMPMPEYDLSDRNNVKMIIPGTIINENYTRILIEKKDLELTDVLALDRIQKKQKISSEAARGLKKRNLIEGRYPAVYISAAVAEIASDKARYIKNRGFHDAHYEKMILKYLDKFKTATRREIDELILNKLPEIFEPGQKIKKISNLLSKMKKNRLIINSGIKSKPLWKRTKIDKIKNRK
ncbi:putative DNA binding domain-containing protein [bacterium]|nr:putative DNA binding domain-containing protein [bacterium]